MFLCHKSPPPVNETSVRQSSSVHHFQNASQRTGTSLSARKNGNCWEQDQDYILDDQTALRQTSA